MYEMVRKLPVSAFAVLLNVYNQIWDRGKIIPSWKESIVIPIPKPTANKSKPESYRPIALTSVLCKLFERIMTSRLEWHLDSQHLMNPLQSGFRKQRCTTDHIVRLQDSVHKAINNKKHTLAVFLDFSKAFDMLWKEGLLHKLHSLGVGGNMHRFISDSLTDRIIQVRVGNVLSDKVQMDNGTPQGSIISPMLFNIMINDLPSPTANTAESAIYADDSSAWSSGKNLKTINSDIQKHLDGVNKWSNS